MQRIKGFYYFYLKLFIPGFILSLFLSIWIMNPGFYMQGIGISYFFLAPLFQYFMYERKHPEEYYFYYNLGFSKIKLWGYAIILSLFISISFILV